MSKHGALKLHAVEEAVSFDVRPILKALPPHAPKSPISDYFDATNRLKIKIFSSGGDAETFGLLTIGVISAVEFYLRSIFGTVPTLCPIAMRHFEMSMVPAGASAFYVGSGLPAFLSTLEHESLADGAKIKAHCQKLTGLKLTDDSSVSKVIEDFNHLCELRHCLVHARGFVGLKAANALDLPDRAPSKVLMDQIQVLEVLKVAHNVVRAVNRFLAESIVDRWIDGGLIVGNWARDQVRFKPLFQAFVVSGEDSYGGVPYRAYLQYRRSARLRIAATLANVPSG